METITRLMMDEHERIIRFLSNFEKSLKGSKEFKAELFESLRDELEGHFNLEEISIFNMYSNMKGEEVEDIFNLMREHGEIKGIMDKIKKELELGNEVNFSALKEKLLRHANFENGFFYPKLDEQLNNEQRKAITNKIIEIKLV